MIDPWKVLFRDFGILVISNINISFAKNFII